MTQRQDVELQDRNAEALSQESPGDAAPEQRKRAMTRSAVVAGGLGLAVVSVLLVRRRRRAAADETEDRTPEPMAV
jgi:hypothetical protein